MKKNIKLLLFNALALVIIVACSEDEPTITPAKFNIDITSKDFGSIEVEKKATHTFKISNTGGRDLELKSFTLTGINKDDFSTDAVKTSVKSGKDYSFTVNFAPTAEGNKTATLSIATNLGIKAITLKGKAKPKAIFSINPTNKDFGDVEINKTANQVFTITNTGNANLEITGYNITGTNANQFAVNPTLVTPFTIASNSTKDITVVFSPTAIGSKTATLKLTTSVGEQNVSLSGKAIAQPIAVFNINPTSKDFGDVKINKAANQVFTITNTGNANLEITGYNITGTNANQFTVNPTLVTPFTIASNGTKGITVVFSPTAIGSKTATLKLTTNVGDQTVSLSGNGTHPVVACTTPVNIPNANFKAALLDHGVGITGNGISKIDTNGDGIICNDEANAYTGRINVFKKNINDLTGIEAFTNVTQLYCGKNKLTSLDVSANKALTSLVCGNNQLTNLDVSTNTALKLLYLNNNQLTTLDVSANTALQELYCSGNKLTSLNVSANTDLKALYCNINKLTSLNVSANSALQALYCNINQLTSLNVSANTALQTLYCFGNQLTSLNVSANSALQALHCSGNKLASLNVSANTALQTLYCSSNKLASLNVSANTALQTLYCSSNKLASLNVANGNNGNISVMNASGNANLTCIKHDSGFDPTTKTNWIKDRTANWSTSCQ